MFKWVPFVMVRICLFFIAGILLGIYQPNWFSIELKLVLTLLLIALYFVVYFFFKKIEYRKIISGFVGLLVVFLTGNILVLQRMESRKPDHLLHQTQLAHYYKGVVITSLDEKANSWKVLIEVDQLKTDTGWKETTGKVQLYISKKSGSPSLTYGDYVVIKGSPDEVKPPANPEEFNFKRFLGYKNIYHQQFIKSEEVKILRATSSKSLIYYSYQLRARATAIIKKFVSGDRQQAITLALVLGVTDGIDNDLLGAYSASGALHVLSVSGLHVGIIYFILLLFLKPLSSYAWSRWALAGFTLLFLWAYALITGLSPSVLRAVMMFSFIAIAKPLGWKTNIYNTLAASAFMLLIYNPFLIMSVGFQLSYIAVIGIVALQRPLYNAFEPTSWLLDKVWQVTSVSIAAQLVTFPLGLLYFHQFPVYFLFSNLVVIPLSTLILLVGIALLAVNWIPVVGVAVGYCLEWTIKLLNGIVFWVERLPFSLIDGVYINTVQCWLLIGVVVFSTLLIHYRKFQFLLVVFYCCISFAIFQWVHFFNSVKQNELVVYQIPHHTAFEFRSNGCSYFFADSLLLPSKDKIHFHINSHRVAAGITGVEVNEKADIAIQRMQGFMFFVWRNQKVLWIQSKKAKLPTNVKADYTIISNDANQLLTNLKTETLGKIILDGSCRITRKHSTMELSIRQN